MIATTPMIRTTPRQTWAALGVSAIGLALATVFLTEWFRLDPCHLCIFQRFLLILFGAFALGAAAFPVDQIASRLSAAAATLIAFVGAGVAGYQSWMQLQPSGTVACVGGKPSLVEILVEWLGQQLPSLFLATGFCDDRGMVLLGLSLANWAFLSFLLISLLSIWTLMSARTQPHD